MPKGCTWTDERAWLVGPVESRAGLTPGRAHGATVAPAKQGSSEGVFESGAWSQRLVQQEFWAR